MNSINSLTKEMNDIALSKGFWDNPPSVGESIALMHSELSEALEEAREGRSVAETYYECKYETICPYNQKVAGSCRSDKPIRCVHAKPCGIATELADCVIRIMDFCGRNRIDLEKAISEKAYFNKHRPRKHNKQF